MPTRPDPRRGDVWLADLDNVQLVGRDRLVKRVGRARPETMAALCRALAIASGCD